VGGHIDRAEEGGAGLQNAAFGCFDTADCPKLLYLITINKKTLLTCVRSFVKNRWEDDVKSNITKIKITNWKDCNRNRPKWKEFVEKAKTSLKL